MSDIWSIFFPLLGFSGVITWIGMVVCFVNFASVDAKDRKSKEVQPGFSLNPLSPLARVTSDEKVLYWRRKLAIWMAAFVGQVGLIFLLGWRLTEHV
jgi:hypothetical protein